MKIRLILIASFLLRLIGLNQSLWLDEGVQAWASSLPIKNLLVDYMPGDFNPPLYHLILKAWIGLFGSSEVILRLPSVFLGVISIYLLYLITREILAKKKLKLGRWQLNTAETTALLLAVAPLHIYYSQEARMYSLACFSTLLTVYGFLKFIKKPNRLCAMRYTLCVSAMLYSHYLAWLMLPVFWLAGFLLTKNKKVRLQLLVSQIVSLVLFIPWLPQFVQQLKTGLIVAGNYGIWSKTVGSVSLKSLVLVPIKFTIGRISLENNLIYGSLLLPALLLTGFLLLKALKKTTKKESFLWLWLILPLLLGAAISLKVPAFFYFRFLFVLPAFYLLLLVGLLRVNKKFQSLLLSSLVGFSLICSLVYLIFPRFHRENWQKAVQTIHLLNQQQAPVLIIDQVRRPFEYYDQKRSKLLDYSQVVEVLDQGFVWLVKYSQPIFEPDNKTEKLLLSESFEPIYEAHFRGVTIKKFIKLSMDD